MDSGFQNSLPSTTEWLCEWVNAYKKQEYRNEWQWSKLCWSSRNHPLYIWIIPSNYRPITCLPLTAQIRGKNLYQAWRTRTISGRTKKVPQGNKKPKRITIVCIGYEKAFDMVPQTWIIEWNVQPIYIWDSMENWRVELITVGQIFAEVKIRRGIFQGHLLSLQLFVIAMMLLNYMYRKCTGVYKLKNQWKGLIILCILMTSMYLQKMKKQQQ